MRETLPSARIILGMLLVLSMSGWFSSLAVARPLQISVSIPPMKWLAQQVGASLVSCQVLVQGGREPHTFSPTPRQMARLFRSRLYFSLDMPLDRELGTRIHRAAPKTKIIDLTENIKKIPIITSGSDVKHPDPHVWLSPLNLQAMASTMVRALMEVDPDHRETYTRNLEKTRRHLERLHSEISAMLAPCRGRSVYVFHPAFGYFTHTYGLRQRAVEMGGKAPAPARLAALVSRMKKEKVRVLFVQPQFDRRSMETIARAIQGAVVPLDPLAEDVPTNLGIMAKAIHAALCSP